MEDMKQIPYCIHAAAMQRLKDSIRRLSIALLILAGLLIVSNAMWIMRM